MPISELGQVENWNFLCSINLWPEAVWHRIVLWMDEHLLLFTRMLQSTVILIAYLLGFREVYHDYSSSAPKTRALEVWNIFSVFWWLTTLSICHLLSICDFLQNGICAEYAQKVEAGEAKYLHIILVILFLNKISHCLTIGPQEAFL